MKIKLEFGSVLLVRASQAVMQYIDELMMFGA